MPLLPAILLALTATAPAAHAAPAVPPIPTWSIPSWTKLPTNPYPGKQDDIVFPTPAVGFYGNGQGFIYKSTDAGDSWTPVFHQPGTFVRCLGFIDDQLGFAGNIGPGYFPNVTDTTALYRTRDGGQTWEPVPNLGAGAAASAEDPAAVVAPDMPGLCAIEIARFPYINAGVPGEKTLIVAGGRVGGPAMLVLSDDLGETWRSVDLRDHGGMVLDVHFFTNSIGLVATASSTDVQESHARIIRTEDGGTTWSTVYESDRPFELTWKFSFPSRSVGYCTVQSYNPDPAASQRVVAKTTDGGRTWSELPLVDDHRVRQFGVGFLDEHTGFVGAMPHGFVTRDGGQTWQPTDFGNAVNKIRVYPADTDADTHPDHATAYAIGVELHRLHAEHLPTDDGSAD